MYPWGDEKPDVTRANYNEGEVGPATPVGLYPAGGTPEGIQDMAGNVYEWLADVYAPYGNPSEKDDSESNPMRVVRGGCWYFRARYLRAAVRYRDEADHGSNTVGFRCVRDVPPNSATIQS